MLSAQDHARLTEAAELVHDVIVRHDADMTLPALVALQQALLDMRIGERYLNGGPVPSD